MPKKLFVKSFGCQMNEYDSEKIADILAASHGFTSITSPDTADLIVLNTCSIREKAAEKIFSELGRLRKLKNKNPELILAVGGCVSSQEQKNIFRRAPYVSIVFGPQTLHRLPSMYERALKNEKRIIDTSFLQIEKFDHFPNPSQKGPIAYVSIMEGCNNFCSYCIVPYTRGRETNRKIENIIAEITALANNGIKEINLLGQNVNAYRDPNNNADLSTIIDEISKIETLERIRFTTSHPAEFTDDLIAAFKQHQKLANHIHLPIQSGSNRILKLMRRGYTKEEYKNIIFELKQVRPTISVSTDIIVGFPGETEEDFAETMDIVKEIDFDSSFTFIYSPRPNTPAAKMQDETPLNIKKERLSILQDQLGTQARRFSKEMIGTIQKVLITKQDKKNPQKFSGVTENNRVVNFSSPQSHIGDIARIKITEAVANSLSGELFTN